MDWTLKDDAYVRKHYLGARDKEIAAVLGRTAKSVSQRRAMLGLLKYKRPHTEIPQAKRSCLCWDCIHAITCICGGWKPVDGAVTVPIALAGLGKVDKVVECPRFEGE